MFNGRGNLNGRTQGQDTLSVPCYMLCLLIVLVIGILPIVPGTVTQLLRPAFIGVCLLFLQKNRYPLPLGAKTAIIYHIYLGIILLYTDTSQSSVRSYFAMVLFCGFFVCAAQRVWSKREIRFILNITVFIGLFCAIVLLIGNPVLRTFNGSVELKFFHGVKNRNPIAFSLATCTLCSAFLLFYRQNKSVYLLILYALAFFIPALTTIATGGRSASLSMLVGTFLILWEKTQRGKTANSRIWKKLLLIMLAVLSVSVMMLITKDSNSARIFSNLSDSSGRDRLWDFAWELIKEKPVFGGGFSYWEDMGGSDLSTHNTYLLVMVISGWVGALFLTGFLGTMVLDLWKKRNFVLLAFIVELACHTYSESGMDYYAYLPLVISYILRQYLEYQSDSFDTLFVEFDFYGNVLLRDNGHERIEK